MSDGGHPHAKPEHPPSAIDDTNKLESAACRTTDPMNNIDSQRVPSSDVAAEHLVFIFHSSGVVGVERSTVALIRAAKRQHARVTVVLPRPGPILEILNEIDGIEVSYLRAQWWMGWDHAGWRGLIKLLQAALQIALWWPAITRLRPTAVYVMSTVIPTPMLAARLARVPLVVFLSESILRNPGLNSVLPKSWLIKFIKATADVTVARSNFAAEQYGGANLIEAPDVSQPDAAPIDFIHKPDQLCKIVMLGSLSTEKGQPDAVRAVSAARSKGVQIKLDLYGEADPEELATLNSLIKSLGADDYIRHRGVSMDPLGVFRTADLSLVCSRNEAYGRVTVESLSVGTPVLGYRAGGTAEILEDGGGVVVDLSIDALTEALVVLGTDHHKYQELVSAAAARQRTRRGFGDADRTIRNVRHALGQER